MAATIDLRDKKSLDPEMEAARANLAAQREQARKASRNETKERNAAYTERMVQVSARMLLCRFQESLATSRRSHPSNCLTMI
jgi:hypothetical protein